MSLYNINNQPDPQENGQSSFSFSSYQQIQELRRRRARSVRIASGLAVFFCLLTVFSNLMLLQMYRATRPETPPVTQDQPAGPTQTGTASPTPQQPAGTQSGTAGSQPTGSGDYTMEITPTPGSTVSGVVVTDVSAVVEKASVSVVGIISETYGGYYGSSSSGTGTGIILSTDGYIVTNHHVVEGGTVLTVVLSGQIIGWIQRIPKTFPRGEE